jgi:hypothetical protein
MSESGDNGKLQPDPELTDLQKKQKLFDENPDRFVNLDDLVLAVKRNTNTDNIETFIGAISRNELEVSLMRITHQAFGIFNAMSYAQQEANKPKIQAPGGILNFARRMKK